MNAAAAILKAYIRPCSVELVDVGELLDKEDTVLVSPPSPNLTFEAEKVPDYDFVPFIETSNSSEEPIFSNFNEIKITSAFSLADDVGTPQVDTHNSLEIPGDDKSTHLNEEIDVGEIDKGSGQSSYNEDNDDSIEKENPQVESDKEVSSVFYSKELDFFLGTIKQEIDETVTLHEAISQDIRYNVPSSQSGYVKTLQDVLSHKDQLSIIPKGTEPPITGTQSQKPFTISKKIRNLSKKLKNEPSVEVKEKQEPKKKRKPRIYDPPRILHSIDDLFCRRSAKRNVHVPILQKITKSLAEFAVLALQYPIQPLKISLKPGVTNLVVPNEAPLVEIKKNPFPVRTEPLVRFTLPRKWMQDYLTKRNDHIQSRFVYLARQLLKKYRTIRKNRSLKLYTQKNFLGLPVKLQKTKQYHRWQIQLSKEKLKWTKQNVGKSVVVRPSAIQFSPLWKKLIVESMLASSAMPATCARTREHCHRKTVRKQSTKSMIVPRSAPVRRQPRMKKFTTLPKSKTPTKQALSLKIPPKPQSELGASVLQVKQTNQGRRSRKQTLNCKEQMLEFDSTEKAKRTKKAQEAPPSVFSSVVSATKGIVILKFHTNKGKRKKGNDPDSVFYIKVLSVCDWSEQKIQLLKAIIQAHIDLKKFQSGKYICTSWHGFLIEGVNSYAGHIINSHVPDPVWKQLNLNFYHPVTLIAISAIKHKREVQVKAMNCDKSITELLTTDEEMNQLYGCTKYTCVFEICKPRSQSPPPTKDIDKPSPPPIKMTKQPFPTISPPKLLEPILLPNPKKTTEEKQTAFKLGSIGCLNPQRHTSNPRQLIGENSIETAFDSAIEKMLRTKTLSRLQQRKSSTKILPSAPLKVTLNSKSGDCLVVEPPIVYEAPEVAPSTDIPPEIPPGVPQQEEIETIDKDDKNISVPVSEQTVSSPQPVDNIVNNQIFQLFQQIKPFVSTNHPVVVAVPGKVQTSPTLPAKPKTPERNELTKVLKTAAVNLNQPLLQPISHVKVDTAKLKALSDPIAIREPEKSQTKEAAPWPPKLQVSLNNGEPVFEFVNKTPNSKIQIPRLPGKVNKGDLVRLSFSNNNNSLSNTKKVAEQLITVSLLKPLPKLPNQPQASTIVKGPVAFVQSKMLPKSANKPFVKDSTKTNLSAPFEIVNPSLSVASSTTIAPKSGQFKINPSNPQTFIYTIPKNESLFNTIKVVPQTTPLQTVINQQQGIVNIKTPDNEQLSATAVHSQQITKQQIEPPAKKPKLTTESTEVIPVEKSPKNSAKKLKEMCVEELSKIYTVTENLVQNQLPDLKASDELSDAESNLNRASNLIFLPPSPKLPKLIDPATCYEVEHVTEDPAAVATKEDLIDLSTSIADQTPQLSEVSYDVTTTQSNDRNDDLVIAPSPVAPTPVALLGDDCDNVDVTEVSEDYAKLLRSLVVKNLESPSFSAEGSKDLKNYLKKQQLMREKLTRAQLLMPFEDSDEPEMEVKENKNNAEKTRRGLLREGFTRLRLLLSVDPEKAETCSVKGGFSKVTILNIAKDNINYLKVEEAVLETNVAQLRSRNRQLRSKLASLINDVTNEQQQAATCPDDLIKETDSQTHFQKMEVGPSVVIASTTSSADAS